MENKTERTLGMDSQLEGDDPTLFHFNFFFFFN